MRQNLEADLNTKDVYEKIVNKSNNRPYSLPKRSWSVPVYYVWRLLRYDLGSDISYPIIAQGMLVGHPQEAETKVILLEIESDYSSLKDYNGIRRIL